METAALIDGPGLAAAAGASPRCRSLWLQPTAAGGLLRWLWNPTAVPDFRQTSQIPGRRAHHRAGCVKRVAQRDPPATGRSCWARRGRRSRPSCAHSPECPFFHDSWPWAAGEASPLTLVLRDPLKRLAPQGRGHTVAESPQPPSPFSRQAACRGQDPGDVGVDSPQVSHDCLLSQRYSGTPTPAAGCRVGAWREPRS